MPRTTFAAGDELTSADLNAISKAASRTFVAGAGVKIDQTADVVTIHAMVSGTEDIRSGVVVSSSVGSAGVGYPDDVEYTVTCDGCDGDIPPEAFDEILLRPAYGAVRKIKAQRDGTPVLVWWRRQSDGTPPKPTLLVLSEEEATRVCGS